MAELRATREKAGLTQYDLAERLGRSQSYVGKCELGERRMDVVQLRDFCRAIGISFLGFIQRYEALLEALEQETAKTKTKAPSRRR